MDEPAIGFESAIAAKVRLANDDPRAHSDLGTALLASDDALRAMAKLRRAIAFDPSRATPTPARGSKGRARDREDDRPHRPSREGQPRRS
jgi:hypothetical protein